jgi:hypothetical protein
MGGREIHPAPSAAKQPWYATKQNGVAQIFLPVSINGNL